MKENQDAVSGDDVPAPVVPPNSKKRKATKQNKKKTVPDDELQEISARSLKRVMRPQQQMILPTRIQELVERDQVLLECCQILSI